jgi:fructoselysine-6-P-deglycase FrlB-like protein
MEIGQRTRHPFHMYDAIFEQPEALVSVLERNRAGVDEFAAGVPSCKRLFLVGIGTSYNAARVGEHLVRAYGGGRDVRAINSFDFGLYGEASPKIARRIAGAKLAEMLSANRRRS